MAYITGTPEQIAAWDDQARRLYEIESLVVIGSIGRMAMYAQLGWEAADPLSLEKRTSYPPHNLELRDFDVVFPFGNADIAKLQDLDPYPIDLKIHEYNFAHPGGYRIGDPEMTNYPVPPEVFATRTRHVGDTPVRTFTIGTQFCVNGLYAGPGNSTRYVRAWEKFGEFAAAMRKEHPDEFLPDEAYEPFIRLNSQNKLPPR